MGFLWFMLASIAYLLIGGVLNWFVTVVINHGEDDDDDGFVCLFFWPLILIFVVGLLIMTGIEKISSFIGKTIYHFFVGEGEDHEKV